MTSYFGQGMNMVFMSWLCHYVKKELIYNKRMKLPHYWYLIMCVIMKLVCLKCNRMDYSEERSRPWDWTMEQNKLNGLHLSPSHFSSTSMVCKCLLNLVKVEFLECCCNFMIIIAHTLPMQSTVLQYICSYLGIIMSWHPREFFVTLMQQGINGWC